MTSLSEENAFAQVCGWWKKEMQEKNIKKTNVTESETVGGYKEKGTEEWRNDGRS